MIADYQLWKGSRPTLFTGMDEFNVQATAALECAPSGTSCTAGSAPSLAATIENQWKLLKPPVPFGGFIHQPTQTLWLVVINPWDHEKTPLAQSLVFKRENIVANPGRTIMHPALQLYGGVLDSVHAAQCVPVGEIQ